MGKFKNAVILCVIHHRQNPLESANSFAVCSFRGAAIKILTNHLSRLRYINILFGLD
jgi:hypothetical protein